MVTFMSAGSVPIHFSPYLRRAIIVVLLLAAFSATWNGYSVAGLKISDFLLLATLGAVAVTSILGSLVPRLPAWWWIPTIALVAAATVRYFDPIPSSLAAIRYPAAAGGLSDIVKAALWSLALVGLPLAITGCAALERRVPRWTAEAFLAGVVLSSTVSLIDFTGVTNISGRLSGDTTLSDRQIGLTNHPNTLGLTCVLAAPIAVYLLAERRRRVVACLALVILLGGAVASGSRGAQAAFPIAIVIAAALSPRRREVFTWLAALAIPVGVGGAAYLSTVPSEVRGQLLRFSGSGGSGKSDAERTFLAHQALSDLREFPFVGVGISHINEAHSIYLQVLSAGGLMVTVAVGIYFVMVLRAGWIARAHDPQLAAALLASIAMWLILGAIQNQLTDRYLYVTVGCVAALAYLSRHEGARDDAEPRLLASSHR